MKTVTIQHDKASPWFYPGLVAICLGNTALFHWVGEIEHFFLVFSTGIIESLFWAYFTKGEKVTLEIPDHLDPGDIEVVSGKWA